MAESGNFPTTFDESLRYRMSSESEKHFMGSIGKSFYGRMYCRCLVTLVVVEWPYHLSRRGGGGAVIAAYVSVGTTSLDCSVLECGQVYSTLCIYSWSP
jgi:hypothetical protein